MKIISYWRNDFCALYCINNFVWHSYRPMWSSSGNGNSSLTKTNLWKLNNIPVFMHLWCNVWNIKSSLNIRKAFFTKPYKSELKTPTPLLRKRFLISPIWKFQYSCPAFCHVSLEGDLWNLITLPGNVKKVLFSRSMIEPLRTGI